MATKAYVVVVHDDDDRTFTVEGPVSDDTRWTNAVAEAQSSGRKVGCSATSGQTVEQVAEDYERSTGYTRLEKGSIVSLSVI